MPTIILKPSVAGPIAAALAGLFFIYLGIIALAFVGWWALWMAIPLFGLGFVSARAALLRLRRRPDLILEIDEHSVCLGRTAVTRKEVVRAAAYKDLLFKGVRLELLDGATLGIPHHLHSSRRVLGALRAQGYPVAD